MIGQSPITRDDETPLDQAAELAEMCRQWRERANLRASRAAQLLGIPTRTYEGIEQGRGFRYPALLALAIKAFD